MQNGKEKYKIWKMKNERREGQEKWIKTKAKAKKKKKKKKKKKEKKKENFKQIEKIKKKRVKNQI